jgi:hypothetical protein
MRCGATGAGSELIGPLTAAPDLDGAAIVDRLLDDLRGLDEPLWLVLDDMHELEGSEAFDQLQRLLSEAAPALKLVLATRRDRASAGYWAHPQRLAQFSADRCVELGWLEAERPFAALESNPAVAADQIQPIGPPAVG